MTSGRSAIVNVPLLELTLNNWPPWFYFLKFTPCECLGVPLNYNGKAKTPFWGRQRAIRNKYGKNKLPCTKANYYNSRWTKSLLKIEQKSIGWISENFQHNYLFQLSDIL